MVEVIDLLQNTTLGHLQATLQEVHTYLQCFFLLQRYQQAMLQLSYLHFSRIAALNKQQNVRISKVAEQRCRQVGHIDVYICEHKVALQPY